MNDNCAGYGWYLLVLLMYMGGKSIDLPTKTVSRWFYECPECGEQWSDEYSAPNYCPKCGMVPLLKSEEIKVYDFYGNCACSGCEVWR